MFLLIQKRQNMLLRQHGRGGKGRQFMSLVYRVMGNKRPCVKQGEGSTDRYPRLSWACVHLHSNTNMVVCMRAGTLMHTHTEGGKERQREGGRER